MYKSFLICEHEDIIALYANGVELGIYHKGTKGFEIKSKSFERLPDAARAFFAASLLLNSNKDKIQEHFKIK